MDKDIKEIIKESSKSDHTENLNKIVVFEDVLDDIESKTVLDEAIEKLR